MYSMTSNTIPTPKVNIGSCNYFGSGNALVPPIIGAEVEQLKLGNG